MNIKVLAFSGFTLAVMGATLSTGVLPDNKGFSKPACVQAMKEQTSELLSKMNTEGLCGCFAQLGLTAETADYKTAKSCLDNYLKEPIINSCEKDEKEKFAAQNTNSSEGDNLTDDTHLYQPAMNCECVYDHAAHWVWKNFDAKIKSKPVKPEDANKYALTTMNECRWK